MDFRTVVSLVRSLETQDHPGFRPDQRGLNRVFDDQAAEVIRNHLVAMGPASAFLAGQELDDSALVQYAEQRAGQMVLLGAYSAGSPSIDESEKGPYRRQARTVLDSLVKPVYEAGQEVLKRKRDN